MPRIKKDKKVGLWTSSQSPWEGAHKQVVNGGNKRSALFRIYLVAHDSHINQIS